jgi:acyl-CoA thioester hydrolase
MPLISARTFRVRYYECDAYGYVKPFNYLNYMQAAAFDATAAAGYDLARYEAMERYWLVRATHIDYVRPLGYGDSVEVKTWVADFRRVRSRRAYEFRLVGSGVLVAQAHTDWAFIDTSVGRPTLIPSDLMAAFFPEGVPEAGLPRSRFPSQPPPPPGIFEMKRKVAWGDIDTAHNVNNAVYLAYLDDCGVQAATARGWPPSRMQAERFAIVARQHQIEHRQPGVLGDELELATWVSDVDGDAAMRHYTVTRAGDGTLLARARMLWETVNSETRQPTPIPQVFLADLAPNITG